MDWKKLLGSITASVDEELRLRNAYLVAENRLLCQQIPGRVQLTDSERKALAEMGQVVRLFASSPSRVRDGPMCCRPRLGGLLKDDYREAA